MGGMATLGNHAGSALPGMESTPVQRTTDSSFVGPHYANLGATAAEQVTQLKVTKEQMEMFVHKINNYWCGGERTWMRGNGEECLDKVLGKGRYGTSQYGPNEIRVQLKNGRKCRMVLDSMVGSYFEPKAFGEVMMKTISSCDVE
jgi:hypothetical protein